MNTTTTPVSVTDRAASSPVTANGAVLSAAPPAPGRRAVIVAGWSMVVIAVLHTIAHSFHPYWIDWFTGGLWSAGTPLDSIAFFWALPGGFVPVLALLGLLVVRMGRRDDAVPGYVGWTLGIWVVGCLAMLGPSGFMFGLVPAALLIVTSIRRRRAGWVPGAA